MAVRVRPVSHEDRLALVDHLDELRSRLIACVLVFIAAFAFCFWQDDKILDIVNEPLIEATEDSGTKASKGRLEQTARFQVRLRGALVALGKATTELEDSEGVDRADKVALAGATRELKRAADAAPSEIPGRQPVTLGVAEPFTTTITVAAYAAILLALPFLLYHLYAFILPAFTPEERKAVFPLMLAVPFLFIAGVLFAYFLMLYPAVKFLQGFNDESYDVLVQAKDYYKFAVIAMGGIGLAFQLPIGILALSRLEHVNTQTLRAGRRFAILAIAVLAAVITPSVDPVTMLIAMGPLIVLYELSILLVMVFERRERRRLARDGLDESD